MYNPDLRRDAKDSPRSSSGTEGVEIDIDIEIESKVVVVPNGIGGIENCDGSNDLNTFVYGR